MAAEAAREVSLAEGAVELEVTAGAKAGAAQTAARVAMEGVLAATAELAALEVRAVPKVAKERTVAVAAGMATAVAETSGCRSGC